MGGAPRLPQDYDYVINDYKLSYHSEPGSDYNPQRQYIMDMVDEQRHNNSMMRY